MRSCPQSNNAQPQPPSPHLAEASRHPSLILTGTFGKVPDIRQASGITTPRYHNISEVCEPSASRTHLRDGYVLPLYTSGDRTERHRLVLLSRDQRRIRLPRSGDLVEVHGRPEVVRFKARDGSIRELHQIVVERLRVLALGPVLNRSIILTGYLGNDPELRLTQERSYIGSWENRVAEMTETYEGRTRAREYMVLSLYTHEQRRTFRHRLVVWSSDHTCHRNIRLMRQGDLVKVQGRREEFSFNGADGTTSKLRQIIVERMRVLRRKNLAPEIP